MLGFFASLAGQIGRQLLHRVWPARFVGSRPHLSAIDAEAAMAHERLSEIYYFSQEMFPTLHSLFRSLNALEAAGPSPALARIYINACIGAGLAPLHVLAERYRALAIETAHSVDDLAALSWVMHVAGMYDTGIGNWARAHLALQEATDVAARLGDWRRWESTLKLHSLVYAHQGQFAIAAQLGADCYASGKRRGDKQGQACGLQTLVEHALVEGRLDDALALVEEARGLADETADRLAQLWTNGLLALTRHRLGDRRLALEAAERAMRFIEGSAPSGPWTRDAYAAVAEVYLACWADGDRACARLADKACAALARFAKVYPTTESLVGLYHGRRAWQRGHHATARRHWQRGLAAAQRLAMPFDEARLRFEIGRHLPDADPARREHLETAHAILARIGATDELARVTATLHHPLSRGTQELT